MLVMMAASIDLKRWLASSALTSSIDTFMLTTPSTVPSGT